METEEKLMLNKAGDIKVARCDQSNDDDKRRPAAGCSTIDARMYSVTQPQKPGRTKHVVAYIRTADATRL